MELGKYKREILLDVPFRRRFGKAVLTLSGTVEELARALGVKPEPPLEDTETPWQQYCSLRNLMLHWTPDKKVPAVLMQETVRYLCLRRRQTYVAKFHGLAATGVKVTQLKTDAVVTLTNLELENSDKFSRDTALYKTAGPLLYPDRLKVMEIAGRTLEPGECIITRGYCLPAKYLIHYPVPEPCYLIKSTLELRSFYARVLDMARQMGIKSLGVPIAAPLEGSGKPAIKAAISELGKGLDKEMIP